MRQDGIIVGLAFTPNGLVHEDCYGPWSNPTQLCFVRSPGLSLGPVGYSDDDPFLIAGIGGAWLRGTANAAQMARAAATRAPIRPTVPTLSPENTAPGELRWIDEQMEQVWKDFEIFGHYWIDFVHELTNTNISVPIILNPCQIGYPTLDPSNPGHFSCPVMD